jgi:hypothetical protein
MGGTAEEALTLFVGLGHRPQAPARQQRSHRDAQQTDRRGACGEPSHEAHLSGPSRCGIADNDNGHARDVVVVKRGDRVDPVRASSLVAPVGRRTGRPPDRPPCQRREARQTEGRVLRAKVNLHGVGGFDDPEIERRALQQRLSPQKLVVEQTVLVEPSETVGGHGVQGEVRVQVSLVKASAHPDRRDRDHQDPDDPNGRPGAGQRPPQRTKSALSRRRWRVQLRSSRTYPPPRIV